MFAFIYNVLIVEYALSFDGLQLTKKWFDRGDVERLRTELHTWCTEALSQL